MGLRLHHVSSVVLVCVVMLLRDKLVVDAAQPSEPFVDFPNVLETPEFCLLTPGLRNLCLFSEKIRFKENATGPVFSFSTKFVADIGFGQPSASEFGYGGSARNLLEGFTFALLPHPNASPGGDGGHLGLLNATSNGDPKSHTFAVEFDFVKSLQFSDPDEGFHIGIDINSMNSSSWVSLEGPGVFTPYGPNGEELWSLQVWIDYDASSQILNVSTADMRGLDCPLTDEERPVPSMMWYNETASIPSNSLSHQVDLSDVINEHMYVGFTTSSVGVSSWYPNVGVSRWSLRTSNSTSHALRSAPLSCYEYSNRSFSKRHPFAVKLLAILVSLTAMAVIYALLYTCYSRWVERRGWRFKIDPDDLGDADPHKFTYKELAMATKNFDPKQALGRGGFGSVYKGFLPGNQQYVAVKRVAPDSSQGEREFLAEVMIIGKIRHRNLVRLQGWCHERGELLLVYDYMPQGSLDKHLFGSPFSTTIDLPSTRDEQGVGELGVADEEVFVRFPWERRYDTHPI